MRTYKVKRRSNHTNPKAKNDTCTIGMPPSLAALIPEATRFVPELTDEGLLYRRVTEDIIPEPPEWTQR
jgi:hypothetical protein